MILKVIHSNPRSSPASLVTSSPASLVTAALQVPFEEASSSVRFLQTKFWNGDAPAAAGWFIALLVQKHSDARLSDPCTIRLHLDEIPMEDREPRIWGFVSDSCHLILYNSNKCWTGLFVHARGLSWGAHVKIRATRCNTLQLWPVPCLNMPIH